MQINERLLCQAQELAWIARCLRCEDVWWLAMEILKRSYGR
ncbi:hypothetical protein [Xenorhabdus griffiniae]|uniref:Uncharacterized protein n=1 Tax=Xenorhabdus griffiniae TaxID=351672 RepID=A0ABY9XED7_9GAMM|nr:hypothetical protein [Xenorhabdus griffiniae]WMV71270.1 hypothetical protein QL128_13895 [Xenorhabdus griffiniae]WNH00946.1 hypothetical protein QL112_013900 [Xenorhabdus griffiniae]